VDCFDQTATEDAAFVSLAVTHERSVAILHGYRDAWPRAWNVRRRATQANLDRKQTHDADPSHVVTP
jgi:hypothetical protein